MIVFIYFIIICATYAGIVLFGRWSLRRKLFDVPNERSSHSIPTPRGGGLVIVLICLTVYTVSTLIFWREDFQWSYLLGAALIALISWLDDLYTISFVWRFLVHAISALLVIYGLGGFEQIYLPLLGTLYIGAAGTVLTFFWIVWLTNAYNFMDGIDGIAGVQAVTAGIGWLLIGEITGARTVGFYGGVIAAASFGFLLRNWQPAKIFMGDVGSAFLGYTFAVLPLLLKNERGARNTEMMLTVAVLLVWLFVFDTLWTFGRRVLNGEKVWEAHRGHLYQRYVIKGCSHRFVSSLYALLSIFNVGAAVLMIKNENTAIYPAAWMVLQVLGLLFGLLYLNRVSGKLSTETRVDTQKTEFK